MSNFETVFFTVFGIMIFFTMIIVIYQSHLEETGRHLDGTYAKRKRAKHISYKQVRYYTDFQSERGGTR